MQEWRWIRTHQNRSLAPSRQELYVNGTRLQGFWAESFSYSPVGDHPWENALSPSPYAEGEIVLRTLNYRGMMQRPGRMPSLIVGESEVEGVINASFDPTFDDGWTIVVRFYMMPEIERTLESEADGNFTTTMQWFSASNLSELNRFREVFNQERVPRQNKASSFCDANGWTDLQYVDGKAWAFPPMAVMPVPVPVEKRDRYD